MTLTLLFFLGTMQNYANAILGVGTVLCVFFFFILCFPFVPFLLIFHIFEETLFAVMKFLLSSILVNHSHLFAVINLV